MKPVHFTHTARKPTQKRALKLYEFNIIVHRNQGLLVLNTNVTVSRNLYWSTLSALIAWPGPGRGPMRCDWIWKVPIQVMPTGYLFLHSSAAPARRKVSRIWSVPLHLRLPCPQLISSGQRIGAGVFLCWERLWDVKKRDTEWDGNGKTDDMSQLLFLLVGDGRREEYERWGVDVVGGVASRCVCRSADMCICH